MSGADDYLKWVAMRDGQTMHRSVCDMIAICLGIMPMEA